MAEAKVYDLKLSGDEIAATRRAIELAEASARRLAARKGQPASIEAAYKAEAAAFVVLMSKFPA